METSLFRWNLMLNLSHLCLEFLFCTETPPEHGAMFSVLLSFTGHVITPCFLYVCCRHVSRPTCMVRPTDRGMTNGHIIFWFLLRLVHSNSKRTVTVNETTNSIKQGPWRAGNSTACQEIPAFYRNRNFITVFTRIGHCLCLSQISQEHAFLSCFFKINFNTVLSSTLRSGKLSLYSGFPTKTLYTFLFFTIHATCPAHLVLHDLITRITRVFVE